MCACPLPVRALVCVCLPFTSESVGMCVLALYQREHWCVCLPFASESVGVCAYPLPVRALVCVLALTSESVDVCEPTLYQ